MNGESRVTDRDAPLGTFEEQVLLCVLRVGADAIGMNVRREIEEVTGRDVAIGAVYATLDRLEQKGYLQSRRSRAEGGARRIFSVSRTGAEALAATRTMREDLWRGVDLAPLLRPAPRRR
jgi:PadR family transcriptional regulator PadR